MEEVAMRLIDLLSEKLGIAIDYTTTNVIPYATDLINRVATYNIWKEYLTAVVLLIITVICAIKIKRIFKSYNETLKNEKSNDMFCYSRPFCNIEPRGLTVLIGFICCAAFAICLWFAIDSLISAIGWTFIPEVKILEYVNLISM